MTIEGKGTPVCSVYNGGYLVDVMRLRLLLEHGADAGVQYNHLGVLLCRIVSWTS